MAARALSNDLSRTTSYAHEHSLWLSVWSSRDVIKCFLLTYTHLLLDIQGISAVTLDISNDRVSTKMPPTVRSWRPLPEVETSKG
jgi:hypothetical protein